MAVSHDRRRDVPTAEEVLVASRAGGTVRRGLDALIGMSARTAACREVEITHGADAQTVLCCCRPALNVFRAYNYPKPPPLTPELLPALMAPGPVTLPPGPESRSLRHRPQRTYAGRLLSALTPRSVGDSAGTLGRRTYSAGSGRLPAAVPCEGPERRCIARVCQLLGEVAGAATTVSAVGLTVTQRLAWMTACRR